MAKEKPGIPKGTRDFSPAELAGRNYIFDTIRQVYRLHGFMPIETPAMETLDTLMGKYGEEGDRLIFRILNSGDFISGVDPNDWKEKDAQKLSARICEKALRYDLTVPFARYVVQHQHEISFPFRRYQIQPVWRADRPQKGRYREFFQCDADVVGSDSLMNEAGFVDIIDEVFSRLGVRVRIHLNNRKILAGLAEYAGAPDRLTDITTAIDKLDKIGSERLTAELHEKGFSEEVIGRIQPVLALSGTAGEKLDELEILLADSETGLKGVAEMREVFDLCQSVSLSAELVLDLTLARGLNYYTGAIIEVKARDVAMGSICGGGRYDDLTGIFGMPGMSGVGISFGADRIYDVLKELNAFPADTAAYSQVMIANFGHSEARQCLALLKQLRSHGIRAELYPDSVKLKKQMQYASRLVIPFVIMAGEEELKKGLYTLKNMQTGEQASLNADQLIAGLKDQLNRA